MKQPGTGLLFFCQAVYLHTFNVLISPAKDLVGFTWHQSTYFIVVTLVENIR